MKGKNKVAPFKGIIVPTFLEPNGKMERLTAIVKNPKVQEEYKKLLGELKANPKDFGRKLRETVSKDKTVDELFAELGHGKKR